MRTFRGVINFILVVVMVYSYEHILNSDTIQWSTVYVTSIILQWVIFKNMLFLFHLLFRTSTNTLQRSLSSSKNVAKKPVPAVVCQPDAQGDAEQKV